MPGAVHALIERVAQTDVPAPHDLPGERRGVDRRDQFQGAARLAQRHGQRLAGVHRVEQGRHLADVTAAWRRVVGGPRGSELLVARCRGERPVGVGVAVQVLDLQGRALGVDANRGRLTRRDNRVHDRRQRPAGEPHHGQGHVLGVGVPGLPSGHRGDLCPRAEQRQQEVELVDAVAHHRPTALDVPPPTPRRPEVVGVAVPERVTGGHQRAADALVLLSAADQQGAGAARTGAEPVLEDNSHVHPGALADGKKLVDLGKAQRRRLLQEHRHTRAQALGGQRNVRAGRGADVREVQPAAPWPGMPECSGQVAAPVVDPMAGREVPGPRRLEVHARDHRRPPALAGNCGGMRGRDRTRADDQRPPRCHSPAPTVATSSGPMAARSVGRKQLS